MFQNVGICYDSGEVKIEVHTELRFLENYHSAPNLS